VGWVVWAGIVGAALAGLLGTGPLSHARSSATDESISVSYDRFLHYHQPTVLEVLVHGLEGDGGRIQLKLNRSFLDRIQIIRIEPEPEERKLASDGVVYLFSHDGALDVGKVQFHYEFEDFGPSSGRIQLVGRDSASFQQFVYP
jgi:hypothetical protein